MPLNAEYTKPVKEECKDPLNDDNEPLKEEYTDIGAVTTDALEISRKSRGLISEMIGDETAEDRIKQRCVIATGDPSVAGILRFLHHPVQAGLSALEKGAPIHVDIKMVEAGLLKKGHESKFEAFIGKGDQMAYSQGLTRTSAGVLTVQEELTGSIVVIGNAPSALLALCDLMQNDQARPSLVIGVPVGFVNSA